MPAYGPAPKQATAEEEILKIATDAFGSKAIAEEWLHEPNPQTGNRPPIELIDTPQGFDLVETVLNQIKYAVLG